MDFTTLGQRLEVLSLFKYFPIHVAVSDRIEHKYVFYSSERNWGGYTYEEFNSLDREVKEDFWVQPDRDQQLRRQKAWLKNGSRAPLRLTFRINSLYQGVRRIQTHFEHIPDEEEPDRYILEISWDITEVVDNCLSDRSFVVEIEKRLLLERDFFRAETGVLRNALEQLQDPERLAKFVHAARDLEPEELPSCLCSFVPELQSAQSSRAGLSVCHELQEVQRLEQTMVELQNTDLPALMAEFERVINLIRSHLLMIRVQRNEGVDLDSLLF